MAQGKLKVKTQLPNNVKKHSVHRGVSGRLSAIKKAPKKSKTVGTNELLQKEVTKAIRMNIEEEMRAKAKKDGKNMVTNVHNSHDS